MPGPGAGPRLYQGDIMKKQAKNLVLAKETVKNLTAEQINDLVLGGVSTGFATCLVACFYSQQPSCTC